jgi:hypothetical protein
VKIPGDFLCRRLMVAGEALAIEAEAPGGVVSATELDDIGTEFAQAPPLGMGRYYRKTWRVSEGWAKCSLAAALVKLSSSATATK